jgi:hypothetical protein
MWDCLDPNVTESLAHLKVTETILEWCTIRIYRIDRYNELRKVLVERNLFDGFLLTIVWEAEWERLPLGRRLPLIVQGRSIFYHIVQMPFVKMLLDSMELYIVRFTPVLAPEPELEPEVEPVERAQTVVELPAELKTLEEEVKTLKVKLRETQQELHAVKHQYHEAQRLFFSIKDLCEEKDTFYEERRDADEKLLQTAFEQAKASVALHEAREEILDTQEFQGKPWYKEVDDDIPEGLFNLLSGFPECDWADGNVSDVSVTSSEDDEEDAEEDAEQ